MTVINLNIINNDVHRLNLLISEVEKELYFDHIYLCNINRDCKKTNFNMSIKIINIKLLKNAKLINYFKCCRFVLPICMWIFWISLGCDSFFFSRKLKYT